MSCLSPIDGVGLLYSEKYLKPPEKKNLICIPLFDEVRFQGHIVNIKEHKIIHIGTSPGLTEKSNYSQPICESFFSEREQFDPNSCGVWLVAGMFSHFINFPEISDRNFFDITYNLLERNPVIQKVESLSPQFPSEDKMKTNASANFVIHVLTSDPERSEYYRQSPPKGIRTNFFFITDISKTSISDINTDDNGEYLQSCNNVKFYYYNNSRSNIVREDISSKSYYNGRLS